MLLGTAGLWVALSVSVWMAFSRPAPTSDPHQLRRLMLVGVAVHLLHASEEYLTGFPTRFPALLGLPAWSSAFFVTLNAVCVLAWVASASILPASWRVAVVPIWFFALAGVMNGVAHPALALMTRDYFPGLVTSPMVAAAGALVWRELAHG